MSLSFTHSYMQSKPNRFLVHSTFNCSFVFGTDSSNSLYLESRLLSLINLFRHSAGILSIFLPVCLIVCLFVKLPYFLSLLFCEVLRSYRLFVLVLYSCQKITGVAGQALRRSLILLRELEWIWDSFSELVFRAVNMFIGSIGL